MTLNTRSSFAFELVLMIALLTFPLGGVSQHRKEPPITVAVDDPAPCESNSAFIDEVVSVALTRRSRIFVIAQRASDEHERISSVRLRNARLKVLTGKQLEESKVLFAVNESISKERGSLVFFVGDQLYLTIYARRNESPCMTCCETP